MTEKAEQESTSYGFAPAVPKELQVINGMLYLPPTISIFHNEFTPNGGEYGGINKQTRAVLAVTLVLALGILFSTHCSKETTTPKPTIPWSAGVIPHLTGKEWDTSGEPKPTTKALLADLWDPTPSPQPQAVDGAPEQAVDSETPQAGEPTAGESTPISPATTSDNVVWIDLLASLTVFGFNHPESYTFTPGGSAFVAGKGGLPLLSLPDETRSYELTRIPSGVSTPNPVGVIIDGITAKRFVVFQVDSFSEDTWPQGKPPFSAAYAPLQ